MDKIEKNKWKRFFKFSVIAVVALFIVFLVFKGFSLEVIKKALTYSAVAVMLSFFWVFCVRDVNG